MLNVFGPCNLLGTGIHCMNLAKAYEDLGNEVCLIPPFGQVSFQDERIKIWMERRTMFTPKDPSIMIFDIPFFAQFSGTPRMGFAVFETDGFTPLQKQMLRSVDMVLTPSDWGLRVLEQNGIKSIRVVPEGFNPDIYFEDPSLKPHGSVKFVHVGKYEARKGTVETLKCFCEALQNCEAELLMQVSNPFAKPPYTALLNILSSYGFKSLDGATFMSRGLKVMFMAPNQPFETMRVIYQGADCGIFPYRGEGFGLPLLECIACGTPVIAGNWTGPSEFLGADYPDALSLKKASFIPANDGVWYHGDRGNWYVPDEGELAEKIRWAYDAIRSFRQSEAWKIKLRSITESFTWNKAALKLKEILP